MLAGALAIGAAPAVQASQVSWAHQASGFQSNGAVTIRSFSGGPYTATRNPTGSGAGAASSAATQPPTVIVAASSIPCFIGMDANKIAQYCATGKPVMKSLFSTVTEGIYVGLSPFYSQDPSLTTARHIIVEPVDPLKVRRWGCGSVHLGVERQPYYVDIVGGHILTENVYEFIGNGCYDTNIAPQLCWEKATDGTWFLPNKTEMEMVFANRVVLGPFPAAEYWIMRGAVNDFDAYTMNFATGALITRSRSTAYAFFCLRYI